ncbi:hypothetical protein, partial [Bradyrhizobium uaiense]|uniref:hypothetical protein n=1 Tax=Bradyrhizobium uaiense TaxID=2594946 RepID=UPI0019D590C0
SMAAGTRALSWAVGGAGSAGLISTGFTSTGSTDLAASGGLGAPGTGPPVPFPDRSAEGGAGTHPGGDPDHPGP